MSKTTIEKVDLPGRDVQRVMRDGKCIKILGDGKPFSPQEFMRMGNVIEPTRDPEPELPRDLTEALERAEVALQDARAARDNAGAEYSQAEQEAAAAHSAYSGSTAAFSGEPPPPELKTLADTAHAAEARWRESLEIVQRAQIERNRLQREREHHRQRARERAAAPAPPPTLRERMAAFVGRPA